MQRADIATQVEAYDSLVRHPGWQLMKAEMQKRVASSLAEMENAKSNEELAKHTHNYLTVLKLMKLPEILRDTLAQKLQPQGSKL